jgi:hypothetical protein
MVERIQHLRQTGLGMSYQFFHIDRVLASAGPDVSWLASHLLRVSSSLGFPPDVKGLLEGTKHKNLVRDLSHLIYFLDSLFSDAQLCIPARDEEGRICGGMPTEMTCFLIQLRACEVLLNLIAAVCRLGFAIKVRYVTFEYPVDLTCSFTSRLQDPGIYVAIHHSKDSLILKSSQYT